MLEVDLVTEETTDATESLNILVAFGGSVGDELEVGTEFSVLLCDPLQERDLLDNLHLLPSLLVHELGTVLHLLLLGSVEGDVVAGGVLENPSVDLQVLEDDESLNSTEFESLKGVIDTITDASSILRDLLEVLSDKLLLLDELDIRQSLRRKLNSLVEAVLTTVGNVDDLDDLDLKPSIEEIGLVQVVLEVGGTGQNDTGNVDLVVGDEVLDGQLGDLADVVVTLLLTKTGETKGRLTTTSVFLWKIDRELVDDISGVSAESTEESSITIHDNETELLVIFKQLRKSLSVELVVAQVERGVDWSKRLEVDVDLPLLAFGGQDFTTVDDEAIWWDLVVQLETLLCRSNGGQDGLSVDTGLNVRGSTLWIAVSLALTVGVARS